MARSKEAIVRTGPARANAPPTRRIDASTFLGGSVYTFPMRIIAGTFRGRSIAAPEGESTRPILDRAKTVLFDILGNRLAEPGRLPPVAVLDLFAGSGAMGIEALSRGACYCLFIERHRATARLIRSNLDELGIIHEARVVEGDAAKLPLPPPPPSERGAGYELVFFDPPYRMLTGPVPDKMLRPLLGHLASDPVIAPTATIVVRQPAQGPGPDLSPLVELDRRDVGTMTFRFMTPAPSSAAPGEEA
jgi:16S rRNA (guanine966-N2)-methyltransferase